MKKYFEIERGNTNILISTPHGGGLKPVNIPMRTFGKIFRDSYSKSFTKYFLSEFKKEKPYSVIANIHRSRVDFNRKIEMACSLTSKQAKTVYEEWNYLIYSYKYSILAKFKRGLYLDIHSHNNSDEIQFGYDISTRKFNWLRAGFEVKSTLDSLDYPVKELILGEYSLAELLKREGYKVFIPAFGKEYFSGGRNVETFSGNGLAGIQIELPVTLIRDRKDRRKLSRALQRSIIEFRDRYVK